MPNSQLFTQGSLWQVSTLETFFCGSFIAKRHAENVEVTSPSTPESACRGRAEQSSLWKAKPDYCNCRPAAGSLAAVPSGDCQLALLITCRPGRGGEREKRLKSPRREAVKRGRLASQGSWPPSLPHSSNSAAGRLTWHVSALFLPNSSLAQVCLQSNEPL